MLASNHGFHQPHFCHDKQQLQLNYHLMNHQQPFTAPVAIRNQRYVVPCGIVNQANRSDSFPCFFHEFFYKLANLKGFIFWVFHHQGYSCSIFQCYIWLPLVLLFIATTVSFVMGLPSTYTILVQKKKLGNNS